MDIIEGVIMDELEQLKSQKASWIKHYEPYALTLCLAVLAIGTDDDMGDPDSVCRHHMTAKSITSGEIKIIATEKSGVYLPVINKYATTRRLIIKVKSYQPVYMTYTNDPGCTDADYNIIVPGYWLHFADEIISRYAKYADSINHAAEVEAIRKMKLELLIDVPGFGTSFSEE
jgi:hypothetical protein